MNPVPSIPPQILLQPMRQGNSHSINPPKGDATESVFANYAFGPLKPDNGRGTKGAAPIDPFGKPAAAAPPASTAWIAQLQASSSTNKG